MGRVPEIIQGFSSFFFLNFWPFFDDFFKCGVRAKWGHKLRGKNEENLVQFEFQKNFRFRVSVSLDSTSKLLYLKTMRQKKYLRTYVCFELEFYFLDEFLKLICPMKEKIDFFSFNRQKFFNDNTFMNWQMSGACHQFIRS